MRWISILTAALAALAVGTPSLAQTPSLTPPVNTPEAASPAAAPVGPQLNAADAEAWLDGYMPYALQRGDVAGAVVVVVKDGQVLVEKGYGFSDLAKRKPVDPKTTLFRPGSVSKLFTWTAVMQLVEQGKLNLDADVNTYIDFKIPARDGKPITLRNIMTHTAGFEEQVKSLMSVTTPDPLGKHLKNWVPHRIFAPGTTPAYSNYATALAGYIVERVSGVPFDDYVDQRILSPLGMKHSSFAQPLPAHLAPLMSNGYASASDGKPRPYEYVGLYPAGSLAASGDDMGKFMIAHLNKGAGLLKPETAAQMHGTAHTLIPGVNRMLLGFYEQHRNGHRIIGHGGDTQWFHSNLHLYLDDNVGLFVSMNSAGKAGASGPIRNALFEGFTDRYFPATAGATKGVDAKVAAEHAKLMAGVYVNSRRTDSSFLSVLDLLGQTKITANPDGTISISGLTGLNDVPKKWREVEPFVWEQVGGEGGSRLAAEVKDGKVVRFTGDEIAPFMMFSPAPAGTSSTWLPLALCIALGALLLTGLLWPVVALVRRKYKSQFQLEGRTAKAYRAVRTASLATVITFGAWLGLVVAMFSDFSLLSPKMDWAIWTLHILALVVFVGSALVGLWNAFVVWTGNRSWFAKAWSIVLALSFLVVLYVALVYKLIGFSANY